MLCFSYQSNFRFHNENQLVSPNNKLEIPIGSILMSKTKKIQE